MAFIQDGRAVAGNISVENTTKSLRVCVVPRGNRNYSASVTTGVIGAAALANSSFFVMRMNPSATLNANIQLIRMVFTTITAFTVPVTAGRRLTVARGTGAAASGGTAVATPVPKLPSGSASNFSSANGGDIRYSGTGALVTTGITFEAEPFATVSLAHVGNAGNYFERTIEFSGSGASALIIEPGQLIAIRTPVLFDLGGTWQLVTTVDWSEDLPLSSSTTDS